MTNDPGIAPPYDSKPFCSKCGLAPATIGNLCTDCACSIMQPFTKANDKQYGGTHYKNVEIQPWDYVAANDLGYFEGTAIKYLTRWKQKNGIEDLKKAIHFIEKLIEVEESKP